MTRFTVLLSVTVLVLAIAAMSAGGSGVRDVVDDVIDPGLTDEVEDLVARSLSDYSGLERTLIPPAAVVTSGVPTGMPPFVEIPLVIGASHTPLVDLDALYGVYGYYGAPPAAPALPDAAAPQMIDDTPPLVAWGTPPLDAK